ncbi:MAG: flagellar hook-basal body complex protein FliE [Eubacteriales bacterium]|nr:flagellar hook-basal body complex protein FliE [Eubacteriales bacterium]
MRIENIQNLQNDINLQKNNRVEANNSFEKFFDEAMNLLSATNELQLDAEAKQLEFITGKSDDIISLTMANSRASSAVQFTSQITNKVLNAYQEIMRIAI